MVLLLGGCTRCHEKGDPAAAAFLAAQGEEPVASTNKHPELVKYEPLSPRVKLPEGERIGRTSFTIHNPGTEPLAIAKLEAHCRSCRISGEFERRIDPGASVVVPVVVAVGMLENMPTRRFVQVVLMTPSNQALEQLITIYIDRE